MPARGGRQRLRKRPQREREVQDRKRRRDERRQRALASQDLDARQLAPDEGTEDETQAERDADDPHPARALFGRRDVGDVRLRDRDVRGRDAGKSPRRQEQRQGRGEAEQGHAGGGRGDAPQQHGPAPDPIGQAPPDRDEEELHHRVDRAGHRGDEIAGAEVARDTGQKRDHQAEAQQIQEHGQEQRPQRGGPHRFLGGWSLRSTGQGMGRLVASCVRRHQAPVARLSSTLENWYCQ